MLDFMVVIMATQLMELLHLNNRLARLWLLRHSALSTSFYLSRMLIAVFALTNEDALEHVLVMFFLKQLVEVKCLNRALAFLYAVN